MDEAEVPPDDGWLSRLSFNITAAVFVFVLLLLAVAPRVFHVIDVAQAGVLYRLASGTDLEQVYGEGITITWPFNRLFIYDTRVQVFTTTVDVLSFNGLTVKVALSCRYRPVREELPQLHQDFGPDYERKTVLPILLSSVREVIGNYRPEELYTTHSSTLQSEINRVTQDVAKGHHVVFLPVLVSSISLPEQVDQAIEEKLRQQQEAQAYEFRIAREEQEKERRRIEGEGIAQQYRLITAALTPAMLRWVNIRAQLELAESDNAKIVFLGDKDTGELSFPLVWPDKGAAGGLGDTSGNARAVAAGASATNSLKAAHGDAATRSSTAAPAEAMPRPSKVAPGSEAVGGDVESGRGP